jgi:hypothetical protein
LSRLSQLHQQAAKQDEGGKKAKLLLQQVRDLLTQASAQDPSRTATVEQLAQDLQRFIVTHQGDEGQKASSLLRQINELLLTKPPAPEDKPSSIVRSQLRTYKRYPTDGRAELLKQLLQLQDEVVKQTQDEKEKRLQQLLKQLEAQMAAEEARHLARWQTTLARSRAVATAKSDLEKAVQKLQPTDEAALLKALDEIEQAVKRIRGTIQTRPAESTPPARLP